MERIRTLTKEHDIKLHLDGTRLWHASIATGISMKEYCSHFDTISLCLSKGIGAPIGSILVGSAETVKKARHFRLLFGGGWRQAGLLAAAALWGIKNNWPTMEDTYRRAKWLERAFVQVGCQITNPVHTNMVWIDTTNAGFTVEDLMAALAQEGIKIGGSGTAARVVLHYQITDEAVERFIEVLRAIATSPQAKINADLTLSAMRENPQSIYDEDDDNEAILSVPVSPDTSTVGQVVQSSSIYTKSEQVVVVVEVEKVVVSVNESDVENGTAVEVVTPERSQTTISKEKTRGKLQYRVAQSPSAREPKDARSRVRIVRWGSLLTCAA